MVGKNVPTCDLGGKVGEPVVRVSQPALDPKVVLHSEVIGKFKHVCPSAVHLHCN